MRSAKKINPQSGATLVELMVCAALLGIFMVAVSVLIRPCAEMFINLQNLNRAQMIADTIMDDLRGELLHAQGYIRLCSAGTDEAGADKVFAQGAYDRGSAVEFLTENGYFQLIDAGYVPQTQLRRGTGAQVQLLDSVPPASAGQLHQRYFQAEEVSVDEAKKYCYYITEGYVARAWAAAYGEDFYMGNTIELEFAVRGYKTDAQGIVHATALGVNITVKKEQQILHTQRGVLDLADEPVLRRAEEVPAYGN